MTAVNYASQASGVVAVSMSWGGGEWSGETGYDSDFTTPSGHPGVTFLASSGDYGAPPSYPSASPNVVCRGRHVALSDGPEQLQQRIRLERQRRGHQRLRAAAGLSEGRGHAVVHLSHQSRRLLRRRPQHGLPRLRHVEQPGVGALGPVGRDQRCLPAVGGLDRHRRSRACAGRQELVGRTHANAPHALFSAGRRFPRHHHRHQHRLAPLLGRPGLRSGHRPRHARTPTSSFPPWGSADDLHRGRPSAIRPTPSPMANR